MTGEFLAIAHRGDSAAHPGNTLLAFEGAIAAGLIETDLRLTRDGIVVCSHDRDLARVARRPDRICDLTFAALKAIPVLAGETIPSLAEVLDLARRRVRVVLDVKVPGAAMLDAVLADTNPRCGRIRTRQGILRPQMATHASRTCAGKGACSSWLADRYRKWHNAWTDSAQPHQSSGLEEEQQLEPAQA